MSSNGWLDISTCPIAEEAENARYILVWHVFQGVMVADTINARGNRLHTHWREAEGKWIARSDRLPTERDADAYNCVVVLDKFGDMRMKGWHQVGAFSTITHWMQSPEPPENYLELRKIAD